MSYTIFSEEQYKIENRYSDAARKVQQCVNTANDLRKRMNRYEQIYRFFYDKASGREEIDVRKGKVLTDMRIEAESNERESKEHQAILQGNDPKEAEFIRAVMDNNAKAIERLAAEEDFYLAKYYLACRIAEASPGKAIDLFEECKKSREYESRIDVFVNAIHIQQLRGRVSGTTAEMWSLDRYHSSYSKKEERNKLKNEIYKVKTLLDECERWGRQEKELRKELSAIKENPSSSGRSNRDWIRDNEKELDSIRESLERAKKTLENKMPEKKKKFRAAAAGGRIRLTVSLAVVIIVLVYGNWKYHSADRDKREATGFTAFIPNFTTTGSIDVNHTLSPYFISLRPLESLTIGEDTDLFSAVINPFGAKTLKIYKPMRRVKVHDGTEELYVNCEKLKKLSLPDSVKTLTLANLSSKLSPKIEFPEHLEHLYITESRDFGFYNLEIPKTVQDITFQNCSDFNIRNNLPQELHRLEIYDCSKLGSIDILNHLDVLAIKNLYLYRNDATAPSIHITGDIDYVSISGTLTDVYMDGMFGWIDLSNDELADLKISGKVDTLRAQGIRHITYDTVPRVLDFEYNENFDELVLPEGIEILRLYENREYYTDLSIPSTVKYLELSAEYLTGVVLPDGLEYFKMTSTKDFFDFENLSMPEGVMYWSCDTENYHDSYQSEDCPQEIAEFSIADYIEEGREAYEQLVNGD